MKRVVLCIVFVSAILFTKAQNKYPEKSGKIVYSYEIGGEKTSFALTFDDFGKKQIMDIENKVDGVVEHVKTIIKEDEILLVNYSDKQVIKMPVTENGSSGGMIDGASQGIDIEAIVSSATGEGSSKKGTETLLGKECIVYEYSATNHKGKYWIHKSFMLKAEFVTEGVHTYMEATEFKLGISVPATDFEAPEGFQVTDMTQMQQMMQMFGTPE